ncbi:MAG: glycosyltransferase family 2 protein [Deltaproteobacteria bacterium]
MITEKKVLIIIPAYNEEASIERVIEGVGAELPHADVLVVNDGSTDRTSEKARRGGAIVLDLPFNLGIGGAMQAGYKYADEKGYEIAVQVDGDGQHDPKEIPKLLDVLEKKEADVAIGSRFIGDASYKGSAMRRVGISVLAKAISIMTGQRVTDPTSGFRAASRRAIRLFARTYPQDYPEPEVLVLLSRCGMKVSEVPATVYQREHGESSITKIRAIYYMVKVLIAIFVTSFRRKPPGRWEDEPC